MALSIKHPEADRLARELAAATGEGLTEAVLIALRERLERVKRRRGHSLATALGDIARRTAALPTLDERSADEILGYGPEGLARSW
jgi:antitoxin VapB